VNTLRRAWWAFLLRRIRREASLDYLDRAAKSGKPFFMSVNFMKVHQPNLPHPTSSTSRSPRASTPIPSSRTTPGSQDPGKVRALGLDKGNTLVFWTTDNGAWQDVYPDAGYTPFRGTKGTCARAATAFRPSLDARKIKGGSKNHDIVGGLDLMATFATSPPQAPGEGPRRQAHHLRQL